MHLSNAQRITSGKTQKLTDFDEQIDKVRVLLEKNGFLQEAAMSSTDIYNNVVLATLDLINKDGKITRG